MEPTRLTMFPVALAVLIGPLAAVCAGAAPVEIRVDGPGRVKQYEKIEFRILVFGRFDNPFDPGEVDVAIACRTPSGESITVPAFYIQPYERAPESADRGRGTWMYPAGDAGFRARFTPTQPGAYSCRATRRDRQGAPASAPVTFECLAAAGKGFVRVSARDNRFMEFTDGTPLFAIGQNVAFIGDGQHVTLRRVDDVFGKMAAAGANYARVWTCCGDWAMALEARKSAWGRSWAWKPPFAPPPDQPDDATAPRCVRLGPSSAVDVRPSHAVALCAETRYVLSGTVWTEGDTALSVELGGKRLGEPVAAKDRWADFRREFTAGAGQWWLPPLALRATGGGSASVRTVSLREAAGGPELLWEAEPDRPVRGRINQPDAFMLDEVVRAAERHGIYLQLCVGTRDLYMKSLEKEGTAEYRDAVEGLKRVLRYAVARWGYSTHVAVWEYFNEMNPGLPADSAYAQWGRYLHEIDPYRHLRATSDWGPNPRNWAHGQLDTADLHWYLRPTWGDLSKDAAAAVLDRARLLRATAAAKPALLSEFGLADDRWGLSPHMAEDTDGIHIHNALWASALSGLSGTTLFWWWEQLDKDNAYRHYRPLADFVAGIPFTGGGLRPAQAALSGTSCRVIGLQGGDGAYLWIQDLGSTWWKAVVEKSTPTEVTGQTLTIEGLPPGAYAVRWFDTWRGKPLAEQPIAVAGRDARLAVPAFTRDVACQVVARPATK